MGERGENCVEGGIYLVLRGSSGGGRKVEKGKENRKRAEPGFSEHAAASRRSIPPSVHLLFAERYRPGGRPRACFPGDTEPHNFGDQISLSREIATLSMLRDRARNVCTSAVGNSCGPCEQQLRIVSSSCSNECSKSSFLSDAFPSTLSAIPSSTLASSSSNSCWASSTGSGKSKPERRKRYFSNATRIRKSVRSCGCHRRMRSRKARSSWREGPNSKRTPSARALTWSKYVLIVSRRE